jgi:hypothetical protein
MLGLILYFAACATSESDQKETSAPAKCEGDLCALEHYENDLSTMNQASVRWQVLRSENFRLFHLDSPLRERVLNAAEQQRSRLFFLWQGSPPIAPWRPPCDIYLFPSRKAFNRGWGAADSKAETSVFAKGVIFSRSMRLAVDDPQLLSSVLPHELTHIVLRELIGGKRPLLWADEGAALSSEGPSYVFNNLRALAAKQGDKNMIPLRTLLAMKKYPPEEQVRFFYAESLSLVFYLIALADHQTLIQFLAELEPGLEEALLAKYYGITKIASLEQRWRLYMTQTFGAGARPED